jgi:hypothetical protein
MLHGLLAHPMFGLIDVHENLLPKDKIEEFWTALKVPQSMLKCEWNPSWPESFTSQTAEQKNCAWRWLAAVLGCNDVLAFEWLQLIATTLIWRGCGDPGGVTYSQLLSKGKEKVHLKVKELLSDATKQSVIHEAIDYALRWCSPLRVFEAFPNCRIPKQIKFSNLTSALNHSGSGYVTGWPGDAITDARVKTAQTLRAEIRAKMEKDIRYPVEKLIYASDTEVRVYWKGFLDPTFEPIASFGGKSILTDEFRKGTVMTPTTISRAGKTQSKSIRSEANVEANKESRSKHTPSMMHAVPAFFGEHGTFNAMTSRDFKHGTKPITEITEYFQTGKLAPLKVFHLYIQTRDNTFIPWVKGMDIGSHLHLLSFRNPAPRARTADEQNTLNAQYTIFRSALDKDLDTAAFQLGTSIPSSASGSSPSSSSSTSSSSGSSSHSSPSSNSSSSSTSSSSSPSSSSSSSSPPSSSSSSGPSLLEPQSWTVADTAMWLKSFGTNYESYSLQASGDGLNGRVLLGLDAVRLCDVLGVTHTIHRARIISELAKFKK